MATLFRYKPINLHRKTVGNTPISPPKELPTPHMHARVVRRYALSGGKNSVKTVRSIATALLVNVGSCYTMTGHTYEYPHHRLPVSDKSTKSIEVWCSSTYHSPSRDQEQGHDHTVRRPNVSMSHPQLKAPTKRPEYKAMTT